MFNFTGEMNSQIQLVDIKIMANNRIKLGQPAVDLLELDDTDAKRLFLEKDRMSNRYWIAAIPVEKDADDNVISKGKKINKNGAFGHQTLNHALGGQYSEWTISRDEVQEFEGVNYYPINQTVIGAKKRAELAAAAGLSDLTETEEEILETEDEEEVLETTSSKKVTKVE